ncbi:hypothetical protein [Variovorax paradoxus]|uniref:hypothetical protein n=1 Tax=Variovorax paradoxus TaxID=34073 RepID=UPI002481758D|nr:hypothetical protein [Variovorax paradoxus]WGT64435.1 hypothetical protein QHG62_03605 [Variovorax paradoxus]
MIFNRPASKSGPLFEMVGQYLLENEGPDPLALARMRREASAVLKTPDVAAGHILCSGIAALEWDAAKAAAHVDEAVRQDGSIETLMNALVTFAALGRPDLSVPYALAAAERAPARAAVINEASSVLIALGRVTEAAELQTNCAAIDNMADFEIDAAYLADVMSTVGVSEDWVAEELRIARQVLIDARTRVRRFSYKSENDPDGGACLAFEFGFLGTLDDEFRLDDELASRLVTTDRWNPARLSVHMQYMEAEEDAVVAG